jgi:hypothetical protein
MRRPGSRVRRTCIPVAALAIATLSVSGATARPDSAGTCRHHGHHHNCRRHRKTHSGDRTPPVFAGLTRVCVSSGVFSPLGEQLTFVWSAATDDVTPQTAIVYDIYGATSPGGEDYSKPLTSSPPGASSYTGRFTPSLQYFVVRARDQAGNRDANTVERQVGRSGCPPPPP